MILRRFNGQDNSIHPSADAPPETLLRQHNADGFIDGVHYQRTGTKQISDVWNGLVGSESGDLETGVKQAANAVRTLTPVSSRAHETSMYPWAPED